MSDGWVATQSAEWPRTASSRWAPSRAGQPVPGTRLLQGFEMSWKYGQRVRCSRFPPVVAVFRSCPEAPESSACDRAG